MARLQESELRREIDVSIVNGGTYSSRYHCTTCSVDLQTEQQARAHLGGWKHARCRKKQLSGLGSSPFDSSAKKRGLAAIVVVGDCHGGRALQLMSPLVRPFFYGGTIHSLCVEARPEKRRVLQPLSTLVGSIPGGSTLALIVSYGELDCRMHAGKWHIAEDRSGVEVLATSLVATTFSYAQEAADALKVHIIPVFLAVPPPGNTGDNPKAPFVGSLALRVSATRALNAALEEASRSDPPKGSLVGSAIFTGSDTWEFASDHDGSLLKLMGDGHVHVRSNLCGPVHNRVRQVIAERLGVAGSSESKWHNPLSAKPDILSGVPGLSAAERGLDK